VANDKKFVVKNGLQTQNISFVDTNGNTLIAQITPEDGLSITGDSGQLFLVSDSATGTIFSVNDISGIPSIEVDDDGTVRFAETTGNVLIGTAADNGTDKLQLNGSFSVNGQTIIDASGNFVNIGNITTTGYLRGPSTFTIDPAAHGDNTGTVVIAGNLQVDGTTTTINSTTLTIDDKNIVLASGAANAGAADGAGITIDGANATLKYIVATDAFYFNKPIYVPHNSSESGIIIETTNDGGSMSNLLLTTDFDRDVGITLSTAGGSFAMWLDSNGDDSLIFSPEANNSNIAMEIYQNKNIDLGGDLNVPSGVLKVKDSVNGTSETDYQKIADLGVIDLYSHKYNGVAFSKLYTANYSNYYFYSTGSATGEMDHIRIRTSHVQPDNYIQINDGTAWRNVWHEGTLIREELSRLVGNTTTGGIGTEDTSNTWTKLATYTRSTGNYADGTYIYGLVCEEASLPSSAMFSITARWNDIATTAPTVIIDWISLSSGSMLDYDSLKVIGDFNGGILELWLKKKSTYGLFKLYELSKIEETGVTATYYSNSAWQSAEPTGTLVNQNSTTLRFKGRNVILGNDFDNNTDVTLNKLTGTELELSTSGVRGIRIKEDTNTTSSSGRIIFENDTPGAGTAIVQVNDNYLSFRTGATYNSSSGADKLAVVPDGTITTGTAAVKAVGYAANQDNAYLIAAADNYSGAATNWGTYGFQHKIKTNSGGAPRITIDTIDGEIWSLNNSRLMTMYGNIQVGDGTTDRAVTVSHSDGSTVAVRGYGIIMNRGISYIRPVNADTSTLRVGGGDDTSNRWNEILYIAQDKHDFRGGAPVQVDGGTVITADRSGIFEGGSSKIALWAKAGDINTGANEKSQIRLSYNNGGNYSHSIRTRHDSGSVDDNAIDFYLWDQSTDASTDLGTLRAVTIDALDGLDLAIGSYQINGTPVIDASRNIYANNLLSVGVSKIGGAGSSYDSAQEGTEFLWYCTNTGSGLGNTWLKVADIVLPNEGYSACAFSATYMTGDNNFGSHDYLKEYENFVSIVRDDDATANSSPDAAYVRGRSDRIRVYKTATGTYELQAIHPSSNAKFAVKVKIWVQKPNAITPSLVAQAGTDTGGTPYTVSMTSSNDGIEKYFGNTDVYTLRVTGSEVIDENKNLFNINNGTILTLYTPTIYSNTGSTPNGWLKFDSDTDSIWPSGSIDNITVLGSLTNMVFNGDGNANGTGGNFYWGYGASSSDTGTFTNTMTLNRSAILDLTGVDPQIHIYKPNVTANSGVHDLLTLELNRDDHSTSPSGPAILFKDQDTNNPTNEARIKMLTVNDLDFGDNDEAASNLVFETTNQGTASDKMIITGRGSVGIGTLNPTESLQVIGNIQVSNGRIKISDSAVPLIFNEADNINDDAWWRQVLDGGKIRFDVSTSGAGSFTTYSDTLTLFSDNTVQIKGNLQHDGIVVLDSASRGRSSDGFAKSYTWRAVDNTSSTAGSVWVKIARVTGSQSTRFMITLTGRYSSYADGAFGTKTEIFGQLNNDNNYDISVAHYDFSGTSIPVLEVGQVNVDAVSTDLYVKLTDFGEVVAHGIISDGRIYTDSSSIELTSEPANYVAAPERNIYTSGDFDSSKLILKDTDEGEVVIITNDNDFIVKDLNNTNETHYIWRDHSAGKLYLGTATDLVEFRSGINLQSGHSISLNGNEAIDTNRNFIGKTLSLSTSGVTGIQLKQDTSTPTNTARLIFENSTAGAGTCITQTGDNTLTFRTGATYGSSSGTERVAVKTTGLDISNGSLFIGGTEVIDSSRDLLTTFGGFTANDLARFGPAWSSNTLAIPVGTGEQWIKVAEFNGGVRTLTVMVETYGDNTQATDAFIVACASYSMPANILKLPSTRYNASKLREIRTKYVNNAAYELWVRMASITSSIGGITVRMSTSNVLSTLSPGTEPTVGVMDATLDVSVDDRSDFTIQMSGGAEINKNLHVVGNARASVFQDLDNTGYYLDASSTGNSLKVNGNLVIDTGNGKGLVFWNNPTNYKIFMAEATVSGAGRVPGESTSDYNMYFKMTGGTNRGFVFQNGTSNVAGVDASGKGYFGGGILINPLTNYTGNLTIRNGDTSTFANSSSNIIFAWGGDAGLKYQHSIKSRHQSSSAAGNTMDFFLWDYDNDTATELGTQHALSLESGVGLDLKTGGYRVGGLTVITSDRNIQKVGTGGFSGTVTAPAFEWKYDSATSITAELLSTDTLSFSGDSGQLFSISDTLSGTIFSVNDISGVPSIEVDDDGTIRLAETTGNLLVGTASDNGDKVQVNGTLSTSQIHAMNGMTVPASGNNVTVKIGKTNSNSEALLISNHAGEAHTWFGYFNGSNYITADADETDGKTYLRTYAAATGYTNLFVVDGTGASVEQGNLYIGDGSLQIGGELSINSSGHVYTNVIQSPSYTQSYIKLADGQTLYTGVTISSIGGVGILLDGNNNDNGPFFIGHGTTDPDTATEMMTLTQAGAATFASSVSTLDIRTGGYAPAVDYDFGGNGSVSSGDWADYLYMASGIANGVDFTTYGSIEPSWSAISGSSFTDNKFRIISVRGAASDASRVATGSSPLGAGDTTIIGNVAKDGTNSRLTGGLGITGGTIYLVGNVDASTITSTNLISNNFEAESNSAYYLAPAGTNISLNVAGSIVAAGSATADHFKYGNTTTTATSKTLAAGEFCTVTAATQTITLPATPSAGDNVTISVGDFTDTIIARNGVNIMGLAENLTIDVANAGITLAYSGDATQGWRII
jgi:hypothetical protein